MADRGQAVMRCTLEQYETEFAGRHLIHDAVRYWAARRPHSVALINAARGQQVDWATFHNVTTTLARQLVHLGFRKGDFLATSLPMLTEHVFLEYACFQAGVIHAPLDMRLKPADVERCLNRIGAKGFVYALPLPDGLQERCPPVRHWMPVARLAELLAAPPPAQPVELPEIDETDAAQAIFTTGSTGAAKAALLSHRNITCQNMCLGAGFGFGERTRLLVNLPPSHVGGQSETLMTPLFWGGTSVLLEVFDAAQSLRAIQEWKVNVLGQIPAMFNLEWRLSDYASYDLSSLESAVYGGQQAPRAFLEKLATMAPRIATGLGLTEAAGFCTYTHPNATVDDVERSIGHAMPVYPMSIREPMRCDGWAGRELPPGETGHVCFRGPQTFLGYVNDPEATAKAISRDGYLYTGDLGFADAEGLHFAGRARWLIKPAGYQVFPGEVENTLSTHQAVAQCGVAGARHEVRSEAIVAFVEKKPGAALTVADLKQHARNMASYMRPLHYVILEPGQMPLNRAAKIDYVRLSEMAAAEVEQLRAARRWDR